MDFGRDGSRRAWNRPIFKSGSAYSAHCLQCREAHAMSSKVGDASERVQVLTKAASCWIRKGLFYLPSL